MIYTLKLKILLDLPNYNNYLSPTTTTIRFGCVINMLNAT